MEKEIIVRDVHVVKAFRKPTALFSVLMKNFTKIDIDAFMDAEDIFNVAVKDPDIKLLFLNEDIKASLFSQLSARNKDLFLQIE